MKPNCTILIVDDEPQGQQILKELLAGTGHDLAFASTAQETLEKAAELAPDLILLDIMLPDSDGYKVCRQLRADPHLAEVPIVLLTALNDRAARLAGLEAGADDFISKPFDTVELVARVQAITRLNRYRRLLIERIKFEKVVDAAKDGYLIINKQNQILYANPKARLYLGLPVNPTHDREKNFLELAQQQYQCEPFNSWTVWPALPSTDTPRYLVRPESRNSNTFWLQVNAIALPSGLGEEGMIVQMCDITEQMSNQQDMNSFHAMISHKLRTPLISMVSSLELLTSHAPELSPDEVVEFAQIALTGVQRLHEQVEDILQYLHLPNQGERNNTNFPLDQFETVVNKLTAKLDLNTVTIQGLASLEEKTIPLSQTDVELLLWEVLENSWKFHPQRSPTIDIALSKVEESQNIRITISDDGLHLSPRQLSQILTPYYQGEKLFTGEIQGMGLGLSTAASLIRGNGGECYVYNRADKPGLTVEYVLETIS